uniref:Uncharacterized protein n=1 Tax=Medicago truncatula TaxID=3880 RepID=I3T8Y9_MEDTR|nr:unknown [Medicago truncatula]
MGSRGVMSIIVSIRRPDWLTSINEFRGMIALSSSISTTASILLNEGLTRMTSPTVTPLILTGVPVDIPQA